MSSSTRLARGDVPRRRPIAPLRGLLAALLVAGCSGGLPTPSPAATPGPTVVASAPETPPGPTVVASAPETAPASPPGVTPSPADTPAPSQPATPGPTDPPEPPVASLAGRGGTAVPGELGSYTWAGAGSDAPWLVPPKGKAVTAAGRLSVTFVPALHPGPWSARWAPVIDGVAGDPVSGEQLDAGPIALHAPVERGTWSLQVSVAFTDGGRATWYWRVETGT